MWRFAGGLPELKRRVQLTGTRGKWSVTQLPGGNQHVFTAYDGSGLTWSIGESPNFTGEGAGASRLERAFWTADRSISARHDRMMQRRQAMWPTRR